MKKRTPVTDYRLLSTLSNLSNKPIVFLSVPADHPVEQKYIMYSSSIHNKHNMDKQILPVISSGSM